MPNASCVDDFAQAERVLRDDPSVPPALRALLLAGAARAAYRDGRYDAEMQQAREARRPAGSRRSRPTA